MPETPRRPCVAQDKAGTEALQTQDCDKEAKIRWLQYHDMDTEGLCGMLPLAVGLRVALTHHMDRSEERCLLKGRQAFVHSWDWEENDQQPSVVCPVGTRTGVFLDRTAHSPSPTEVRQVPGCGVDAGRRARARTLPHRARHPTMVPGQGQEILCAQIEKEADSAGPGLRHHGPRQPGQDAAARLSRSV